MNSRALRICLVCLLFLHPAGTPSAVQGSPTATKYLYFAQFGNGGGFSSDLVLTNPSESDSTTGKIEFFDDDGRPMPIGLVGYTQPASSVEFSIAPLGSFRVSTDGKGNLSSGSAIVSSTHTVGGVVRFTQQGIGTSGVGASDPGTVFITPVRTTTGGINTGIAVQNTEGGTTDLSLSLRTAAGLQIGSAAIRNFPGRGHTAMFITQLFPGVVPAGFEGTFVVQSTGVQIAATAVEMGGEAGQFTTLPVTPVLRASAANAVLGFYYVSGTDHGIWLSTREAGGAWQRGTKVLLDGVFNANAVDPDVIRLADGRYRMHYFLGSFVPPFPPPSPTNDIYSAVSSDGVNFTIEGKVFSYPSITDPTVTQLQDGSFLMAAADHAGMKILIAKSLDGRSYTKIGEVNQSGIPELMALSDGSVRLFYQGAGGILSYRSTNGGSTWTAESGLRLQSQDFVADPSVVRTATGGWVMFVKGQVPGAQGPSGHRVFMAESQDGSSFTLVSGMILDKASVPEGVLLAASP